ncbi:hypothetical protein [Tichowtungia aerotolerans]|uniref:Uncharacterized protein n=1 Tax=Tichowtungia aerotolerans TaxID=2697043 RepID=A0A6P1M5K5_9BACT|nr:hypothetical protein [Tichowtungia aerotolerans]QHI69121.1 hypothetical protein GT409_06555 [Tichowtungia aerotolerans]
MKTIIRRQTVAIIIAVATASAIMAAITPTSDDFSSDTSSSWTSVGAVITTIAYDSTTSGDYDDGDPANKLAYTAGMVLTGDGISDLDGSGDGGLRFDTQDAVSANEAIALTISGTMEKDRVIYFSGSVYNDDGSYSNYKAQLWNLTDNTLLAESSILNVSGINHVAYVPVDFSVSYKVTANDDGDTLQIRFVESNDSASRNIYLDNFSVTTVPETLYAYESFDTTATNGTRLIDLGITGYGFSGYTNTYGQMIIFDGLTYTDALGNELQTTGKSGGMTNLLGGTQNAQLMLSDAIEGSGSGKVYMSFLQQIDSANSWGMAAGLYNTVGDAGSSPGTPVATWRSTSSNFGIFGNDGIDIRTGPSSLLASNLLFFVVTEIDLDSGTMTAWINPTNLTDVSGSATWTMTDSADSGSLIDMNLFTLSRKAGSEKVDEIRIGNTLDVVVPVVDPGVQTLTWTFNGDFDPIAENIAQYDYTSDQVYVGSNAVANTLAFNGRSSGTDYFIVDKGTGHEKALLVRTINTANTDFGIYVQKLDFRLNNMNSSNQTRVSWSFDILGTDHAGIEPTNWTVKINTGNYSKNISVSDGWFGTNTSVTAQTFDFVDDDSTWTTVTGSYVIAVDQAGSAGGIQISTDTGGYTSADGIVLDNIQVTIESIIPVYDSALEAWAAGFDLYGDDALPGSDVEPDGLDNLMEYALGGDPTADDASSVKPATFVATEGTTNWFYHVHNERTDDPSLTFSIGTETDLVNAPVWNTNDVFNAGESAEVGGFKSVTNRTEMTDSTKFIRLKVEQN